MNEESAKEFTFIWKIENFFACNQKDNEFFRSPIFTAETLDGSRWCLQLYPRSEKTIGCFLKNIYLNTENLNLNFKIELIGINEEILASNGANQVFEKKARWGWKLLKQEQLDKTSDMLTIRCHMIRKEPNVKPAAGCKAYTKIGVDRCSFQWCIKNPDTLDWSESKTLNFPNIPEIEITLTAPENDVLIDISRKGEISICQLVDCKITLMDVNGSELNSKSDTYLFDAKDTAWKFPPFITKNQLKDKSDTLVKDEMFTLMCVLSASNGILSEGIEKYTYDDTSSADFNCLNVDTYSDLHDNLSQMFVSQKHTDVKLRSADIVFPAHKSILCARSCVFSAMFDVDMSENQTGYS